MRFVAFAVLRLTLLDVLQRSEGSKILQKARLHVANSAFYFAFFLWIVGLTDLRIRTLVATNCFESFVVLDWLTIGCRLINEGFRVITKHVSRNTAKVQECLLQTVRPRFKVFGFVEHGIDFSAVPQSRSKKMDRRWFAVD